MRNPIIFIVIALLGLGISSNGALAEEQVYRWVDKDGVVHFGSRANAAADAEPVKIRSNTVTPPAQAEQSAEAADPPPSSYAQQLREERAEKRKEKAEKRAALEKECEWHRKVVGELEPSTRVIIKQEDGTAVRMDDDERLDRIRKSKNFIAQNCD